MSVEPPRLEPLDELRYDEFWSLFEKTMPADVDGVSAGLGRTREEYRRLPRTVGELLQVVSAGKVAGYVWLEVRNRELHVHALLLLPAFRGRGLGGTVMDALIERYRRRVDVVELGVEPANAPARAVYEQAGFDYEGEKLGFLIMRRHLEASA